MRLLNLIRHLQSLYDRYGDMEVMSLYKPHLKLHRLTFDENDLLVMTPTSKPILKIINRKKL